MTDRESSPLEPQQHLSHQEERPRQAMGSPDASAGPREEGTVRGDEWDVLALRFLDADVSAEGAGEVRSLLENQQFRKCLAIYALDTVHLFELCGRVDSCVASGLEEAAFPDGAEEPASPPVAAASRSSIRSVRSSRIAALGALFAAVAASVGLWFYLGGGPAPMAGSRFAERAKSSGVCVVQGAVGDVFINDRVAKNKSHLHEGQAIRLKGALSSARLKFPDGTAVHLAGDAAASVQETDGQKMVFLRHGNLAASVRPQPAGRPFQLHTSTAVLEVVGTEFAVSSREQKTELSVSKGLVLMKPRSGGKGMAVRSGESGEVHLARILPPFRTVRAPESWSEDFTDGLPKDWAQGEWRAAPTDGRPNGVVAASPLPNSNDATSGSDRRSDSFTVRSHNKWAKGHVQVREDTYVTYRIKMERPEWYQVFLGVRGDPIEDGAWSWNYEYQETTNWKDVEPGAWRTIRIPVRKFKRAQSLPQGMDYDPFHLRSGDPPPLGGLVVFIMFDSQEEDRGMVIDDFTIGPLSGADAPPAEDTL